MGFRFAQLYFALLFILLPFFIWLFARGNKHEFYRFSSLQLLTALKHRSWRERLRALDAWVWGLGLSLAILALMRPQWGTRYTENTQEGIAIVLAIDTSRSMSALDFELNGEAVDRLVVVKDAVRRFVEKRSHDAIGMIVFGELAFTQSPLTTDKDILNQFIDRLEIGMAGDATAMGDGLALSVKRLKDAPAKSKVVLLLSDGDNTSGRLSPLQAAELARDLGIKVYTIGVGSKGKVPFPEQTPWGTRIVMVELAVDEATLTQIAEMTGGKYWNAKNTPELTEIYASIDRLEKTEIKVKEVAEYRELYRYFAIPAFMAFALFPLVRLLLLKRWIGF
jgi:Ca-activated chloride channel family protein